MTQGHKVRIATIGTSGIARRFLDALAGYEGATYAGAYSRDLGRARAARWIRMHRADVGRRETVDVAGGFA